MARVWELSQHSGTHLLMLLAIADFADDDGNAYPSVPKLAEKCRMKSRNANVILAALRASGELLVRLNEGPYGTNLYRVVLDGQGVQSLAGVGVQKRAPLQERAPLQGLAVPPAKTCPKPLQGFADEPSMNHQEPPKEVRKRAAGFDAASIELPNWLALEVWTAWVADRRERGKPITSRAAAQHLAKLAELREQGHTPESVINHSISNGWQGLFAPKSQVASGRHSSPTVRQPYLGASEVFE